MSEPTSPHEPTSTPRHADAAPTASAPTDRVPADRRPVAASAPTAPEKPRKRIDWKRVGILTAVALVTLGILFVIVYNFAPVWWARIIGDFAQEDFGRSMLVGLIVGFCFTLVPLMMLLLLMYRSPVWVKVVIVVLAVFLAAPNLLTLWIELGASGATHAADRILDTEAFSFGGASIWGAVIGGIAFLFWAWLFVSRRFTKRRLANLKSEASEQSRPV
ncbi:hypothetical protein [Microbacterium lacusdiani]